MKKEIHPEFNSLSARCVCGANYESFSTAKEIVVTFCSKCHPFFTGKDQFADAEGRIQKFNKKYSNLNIK